MLSNTVICYIRYTSISNLAPFRILNKSIGYINMASLYNYHIDSTFNSLSDVKSLIIDLRGPCNETLFPICEKLLAKDSLAFSTTYFPNINIPGDFSRTFTNQIYGNNNSILLNRKIILLITVVR